MPRYNSGGVYLRQLQFETPYVASSSIANRYVSQDLMIAATSQMQDQISTSKMQAGSAESTVWSRYGLALKQYVDFVTGFPEYLK